MAQTNNKCSDTTQVATLGGLGSANAQEETSSWNMELCEITGHLKYKHQAVKSEAGAVIHRPHHIPLPCSPQ